MRDKQTIVRQGPAGGRPFGLDDFIKGAGIVIGLALVALLILLAAVVAAYFAIEMHFGPEGVKYVMAGLLILFFLWLAARLVAMGENRQIDAFERWLNAMTAHDVAITRADDQGEIMRQLAPKLIDNATKHEGFETQKITALVHAVAGALKQVREDVTDPFAGAGNLPQLTVADWSDDEDDED